METKRTVIPDAEEIIDKYFPVLDYGFIALKDYMGGDSSIEEAARVSYGEGTRQVFDTRNLLRYLFRKKHTSPFEMVELKLHIGLPIFVMRQLVRHRTACLAGNVLLHFDLPGGIRRRGNQLYPITVEHLYKKFHTHPNMGRMHIRCANENTLAVGHTHIVDIWESGVKPVYRVILEDGSEATMSADHRCLTEYGMMSLKEIVDSLPNNGEVIESLGKFRLVSIGPGRNTAVNPSFNIIDEGTEDWLDIIGWEGWYQISNQGRVRRVIGGKGSRSYGRCKKLTVCDGHACVSLNRPGYQEVRYVHYLMLDAFIGSKPEGYVARHRDGNGLNNLIGNLEWNTHQQNADDRIRDNATTGLRSNLTEIARIEHAGEQMTYDLEVEGPWHNFSAGGIVVHNSLNEYSGRYSIMPMMFYTPARDKVCTQSKKNKQGRGEPLSEDEYGCFWRKLQTSRGMMAANYGEWVNEVDIAREIARIDLPLSTYTYCYWKIDLRNMFNVLSLRCDSHAQWEIRAFANVMAGIVQRLCPLSFEAFQDYQETSVTFTQFELRALRLLSSYHASPIAWENPLPQSKQDISEFLVGEGCGKREVAEFFEKLKVITRRDYSLDLGAVKSAEYFKKLMEDHAVEVPESS